MAGQRIVDRALDALDVMVPADAQAPASAEPDQLIARLRKLAAWAREAPEFNSESSQFFAEVADQLATRQRASVSPDAGTLREREVFIAGYGAGANDQAHFHGRYLDSHSAYDRWLAQRPQEPNPTPKEPR